MKIVPIELPTPFPVGPVNVYLIRTDPLTLIDTGPKTKEAVAVLKDGLRANGVRMADIRRIVLTHAHEDHCGLAKTIRDEAKDAQVYVHDWESGHKLGRLQHEHHRDLLVRAGVPDAEIAEMQEFYSGVRELADALSDDACEVLVDGAEIEFASGSLRVLHTPGHTPGSCSFLREADRTVIAGDCVLKRLTPNPILMPDPIDPALRFQSLAEYRVSLARVRACAPTLVHGGHGEPVVDFEELFHRYVRAIDERQKRVIKLVPKTGASAWDVAQSLFPQAVQDRAQKFLAVSEAAAHLDLAQTERKLEVERKGAMEIYST